MKRSGYRGEHKGSTLKARSKIAASRVFRGALAFVLAVGLMPGLSFAGDENIVPSEEVEEQVSDTAPVEGISELQEEGSGQEKLDEEAPNAPSQIPVTTASTDMVPAAASNLSLTLTSSAKNTNGDVDYFDAAADFFYSFTDASFGSGTVKYAVGNSEPIAVEVTGEGPNYTGTFSVSESQASSPVTVSVTATDENGAATTESYGKQIVVDTTDSTVPTVEWEAVTGDEIAAENSGSAYSYVVKSGQEGAVALKATITVTDRNLRFAANSLDGTEADVTKISTTGTSEKLTPTITKDWSRKEGTSDTYTCEVTFTAKDGHPFGVSSDSRTASIKVTAYDWAKRSVDMASAATATMQVTSIDGDAPAVEVKKVDTKGVTPISTTQDAPTYFKKNDTLSVTITDANYDASKVLATINGNPFDVPTSSGTASALNAGTAPFATEDLNTVSITGTDKVGNPIAAYTGYAVYDNTNPTIGVTYTSGNKTNETLAQGATAYVGADSATVSVSLSDAAPGALNESACEVEYQKGTETAQTAEIQNGVATIDLSGLNDGDTYTISAKAVDKAGNETTYTGTIIADLSAPTYSVVWADTNKLEDASLGNFYSARVATVTIVDDRFDASHAAQSITATGGTVEWSGQVATVTYNGANKKDCQLKVEYTNLAGTAAEVTSNVSDNVATPSTYTSELFNVVVKPIMDVRFMQETEIVEPKVINKNSVDVPCYVLNEGGSLAVTISVIDPAFADPAFAADTASAFTVGGTATPGDMPSRGAFSGSGAVRTATLTFTTECDVSNLTITPPASTYVGSSVTGENPWTVGSNATTLDGSGKYVYNKSGSTTFAIDKTPPTLVSVTYTANPVVYSDKKYYKEAASAEILVTEHNLNNNGTPIAVTLKTGDDEPASQTLSSGSENNSWTSNVTFGKVENSVTDYTLSVRGADLASRALVADTTSGLSVVADGDVGVYTGNVVIDNAKPTLEMKEGGNAVASGATIFLKTGASMTATFADSLIDPTKIAVSATYKVNGEGAAQTLDLAQPTGGLVADSYAYEFTLPADSNPSNYRTYTVTVSGKDAVGNDLEGYTATVIVDPVSPELSVSLSPFDQSASPKVPYTIKSDDQGVPTYYYNVDVKAKVKVTDNVQLAEKGITAKVFEATEQNDAGTTFETAEYTYTNGSSTIEVTGADAAGNPLTSEAGSIAAAGLKDNAYKANFIVDKEKPTVTVEYTAGSKSGTIAYNDGSDEPIAVADSASITATFADANFNKDSVTIDYTLPDGEEGSITDVSWDQTGKKATFSLSAEAGETKEYSLAINAKDLAGNSLAGKPSDTDVANPFVARVNVDNTTPKLKVTYTPVEAENVIGEKADEKRYYAGDVTVGISVTEVDFDPTAIEIDGTPTAIADWTENSESHEWTLNVPKSYTAEAETALTITGEDKVGNKLEAIDSSIFVDQSTGFKTTIIIDKTFPSVSVSFNQPRAGQDDQYDFFANATTATVTVTEANFDAEANTPESVIMVTGTPVTGSIDIPTTWTPQGSGSYSADIVFSDNNANSPYVITVKAEDLANHENEYAYGDPDQPASATQGAKATTKAAGDTVNWFKAGGFFVDTMSPDIEIKMSEGVVNHFGGHDYYGTVTDGALVATITVTDPTFVTAEVMDSSDAALSHSGWEPSGTNAWSTKVRFYENTDGKASTLKVKASDKITAVASGSHVTSYGYGDAAKSGSTTGGNVSTSAKSGTVENTSFILDLTAPQLTAKEATGFSTKYGVDEPYLFYNDQTGAGISVTMTDINFIQSAHAANPFTLSNESDNLGQQMSTQFVALLQGKNVEDRNAKNDVLSGKIANALVKITDYAGNYSVWNISANGKVYLVRVGSESPSTNATVGIKDGASVHPAIMVLDTVAPELTWGSRPEEGQFYKTPQNAIVNVINEINFDYLKQLASETVIVTSYRSDNVSGAGSSVYEELRAGNFSGSDGDWSGELKFDQEGHYMVSAGFTDVAGNTSNMLALNTFTLDWTAPVIQDITFDNNDSRNGKYYKAGRTATITVVEHNWDPSLFTITTNGSIGGWSDNGDTHTCTVSFTTDGTYNLSVSGADKAGNAAEAKQVEEFVIDLTAPTIDFSNVAAQTAYNDTIAPVINYHDEANFDTNGMTWTLTGNKHGGQAFAASQGSSGNDGTVTFSDFPRQVETDDIYTLQAHLTDMAGNEADNSITFSVNRFGSNFIILDEKTFTENKGYLAEPVEIRVQEINVSGAQSEAHGVSVTHGLNTENLDRKATGTATSEGFYIDSGTDNAGWSTYVYHIGSGNFKDDGNYHVVISSTDTATNLNNSASYYNPEEHKVADAEVSFILDTADPMIEGISVVDGRTYDSNAEKLTFTVTDNIGFSEVKVIVDDEELLVEPEMGGLCTVDLPAKAFMARDMRIIATDLAGRTAEAVVMGFHWTDNFIELHLPLVVGGVVVVAAAVIGGVVFVRRRNGQ